MTINPIYNFNTLSDLGIDSIPNNSTVVIIDSDGAGTMLQIQKIANTGMLPTSTISDFLADGTLFSPFGGGDSQLELITEGGHTGWRLYGRDPDNYGDIGVGAIDLSHRVSTSTTHGATGTYSFSTGKDTVSSGYCAAAFGIDSYATNNYCFAVGDGAWAYGGYGSIAMGNDSRAEGTSNIGAIAIGAAASAKDNSVSLGAHCIGASSQSLTAGYYSTTTANAATAVGYYAEANGQWAAAFGSHTFANIRRSTAVGYRVTTVSEWGMAIGAYNIGTATDVSLEVGIGVDFGAEKNGLEVYKDGRVYAPELTIALHDSTQSLTTKEYVDSVTGGTPSGLETLDEGNGIGYRIIGTDDTLVGNIGFRAMDLTTNASNSSGGATGQDSVCFNNSTASNNNTFSSGYLSHASGSNSIAMGYSAWVDGDFAVGFGDITATGIGCFVAGMGGSSLGDYSFLHGKDSSITTAGDYSVGFGQLHTISNSYSATFGLWNKNINSGSLVYGKYNIGTATDTIHEVGIGTADNTRLNAFEIYTDGRIHAPELTIALHDSVRSLTTKEYVDSVAGGSTYSNQTSNYTAVAGDFIFADTTLGAFTITLPTGPVIGDIVEILDSTSNFSTLNVTVGRNNETIMGLTNDLILALDNTSAFLIYTGTDWRLK